jgi:hypothetical protein
VLTPAANAAVTPVPHLELPAVLHTLRQLLEQDDAEVQTLWDRHADALHAFLPQAPQLEQAIQGFDFEAALHLMPEQA